MTVKVGDSVEHGRCNNCQGEEAPSLVVFIITLPTIEFRLCRACAKRLIHLLK